MSLDIAFNPPRFDSPEYDAQQMRALVEELERLHASLTADVDDEGEVGFVLDFNGRTGSVVPEQADYDAFFLTQAEGDSLYAPIGSGVLSFNGRTGAVNPIEGDYTLDQLGDVAVTSPAAGHVQRYNGSSWINQFLDYTDLTGDAPSNGSVYGRQDGAWVQAIGSGGLVQLNWNFDSSTVEADPGSGDVRTNNATNSLVTEIYGSKTSANGQGIGNLLLALNPGDQFYMQDSVDDSRFLFATVNTITDNTTWVKYDVTVSNSGSSFVNGNLTPFFLLFTAGADIVVDAPGPADSMLRSDGTIWASQNRVRTTAAGAFAIHDSTGADSFSTVHDGANLISTFTGTSRWDLNGLSTLRTAATIEARQGGRLETYDVTDTDFFRMQDTGGEARLLSNNNPMYFYPQNVGSQVFSLHSSGTRFWGPNGVDYVLAAHDDVDLVASGVGTRAWRWDGDTLDVIHERSGLIHYRRSTSQGTAASADGWIRIAECQAGAGRGAARIMTSFTGGNAAPSGLIMDISASYGANVPSVTIINNDTASGSITDVRAGFDTTDNAKYIDIQVGNALGSNLVTTVIAYGYDTQAWEAVFDTTPDPATPSSVDVIPIADAFGLGANHYAGLGFYPQSLDGSPIGASVDRSANHTYWNAGDALVLDERSEFTNPPAAVAGKGFIWLQNSSPNVLKFTNDAGTVFDLGVPSALNANAMLRWNGSTWEEAERVQATFQGGEFRILETLLTDYMGITHSGLQAEFSLTNTAHNFQFNGKVHINDTTDAGPGTGLAALTIGDRFGGNIVIDGNEILARNNGADATLFLNSDGGAVNLFNASLNDTLDLRGGGAMRAFDTANTDYTRTRHDGTQGVIDTNTGDLQLSPSTDIVRLDSDRLARRGVDQVGTIDFMEFGQIGTDQLNALKVGDTRDDNLGPADYDNMFTMEFKQRTTLDNSAALGANNYGALVTFAPWSDSSGDDKFQMFMHERNIFYRNQEGGDVAWQTTAGKGKWTQIRTGLQHNNGTIEFQEWFPDELAHFSVDSSSQTGAMKVELPVALGSNIMFWMEIEGFDYSTNQNQGGGWKIGVSGYTFSTGWVNNHAHTIYGNPPFRRVRFYDDGSNVGVVLGETTDVWQYPKVAITKIVPSFGNPYAANWANGIRTTQITSTAGLTFDSQIAYLSGTYSTNGDFFPSGRIYPQDDADFTAQTTGYIETAQGQNYGTIAVFGALGSSGTYSGYSINARGVLMNNNSTTHGYYNDINNEWFWLTVEGGRVSLYNDGVEEARTADSNTTGAVSGMQVKNHEQDLRYVGFNTMNQFNNDTSDTLEASHCGQYNVKDNSTAVTLTLEASTSTDFPLGGVTHIFNAATSGDYIVNEGSGTTLRYFEPGVGDVDTTGGVTIGPGGVATILRRSTGTYWIWGTEISYTP